VRLNTFLGNHLQVIHGVPVLEQLSHICPRQIIDFSLVGLIMLDYSKVWFIQSVYAAFGRCSQKTPNQNSKVPYMFSTSATVYTISVASGCVFEHRT
jgi:hypothetical protein